MSWQQYIDSSLLGSGHVDQAAIISAAGDSVWAKSANLEIEPAEMKTISDILNNVTGKRDHALAEGLHVGKERYVVARVDDTEIYARKGREGICIGKSTQAIIVGHHPEHAQAGNAAQTVGALADYLKGVGY